MPNRNFSIGEHSSDDDPARTASGASMRKPTAEMLSSSPIKGSGNQQRDVHAALDELAMDFVLRDIGDQVVDALCSGDCDEQCQSGTRSTA